jgi:hypothetical protein
VATVEILHATSERRPRRRRTLDDESGAHNRYAAEQLFGKEFMEAKRRS